MPVKKQVIYWVEEWESDDCSVSYDFKTLKDARAKAAELAKKPAFYLNKVKIWKSELVSERDIFHEIEEGFQELKRRR